MNQEALESSSLLSNEVPTSLLPVVDWGEIDYQESSCRQLEWVQKIYEKNERGVLIYCTHPPLVTTGRSVRPGDVFGWNGPVVVSPRGGRATYHGPSQIVIYPIVNLGCTEFQNLKNKDVTSYLRLLENSLIRVLTNLGISADRRCEKIINENGEELQATGVWVGDKKIASIGIAVRRWVAYHGIALNLYQDDEAFKGINPCGFSSSVMTSVEAVLGRRVDAKLIKEKFSEVFRDEVY